MSVTYLGNGLFRDDQGQKWPLWAVNANRSSRLLPPFSFARFDSRCSSCRSLINQDDPYVWDRVAKKAYCCRCG